MNEKEELIELGHWIAVELFGKHAFEPHPVNNSLCEICNKNSLADVHVWQHFPVDPAAAMQVLEKCSNEVTPRIKRQSDGKFCIWWDVTETMREICVFGDTLPIAICKFAKALYSENSRS